VLAGPAILQFPPLLSDVSQNLPEDYRAFALHTAVTDPTPATVTVQGPPTFSALRSASRALPWSEQQYQSGHAVQRCPDSFIDTRIDIE
jgi:hypothetical protein